MTKDGEQRSPWRTGLAALATLVVAVGGILFIANSWSLICEMAVGNQVCLPAMFVVVASSIVARAVAFREFVSTSDAPLPLPECVHLFSVSNMISIVALPGLGFVYRGAYIQKHYNIGLRSFVMASSAIEVIGMLIWAFVGVLGAVIVAETSLTGSVLFVAAAVFAAIGLVLMTLRIVLLRFRFLNAHANEKGGTDFPYADIFLKVIAPLFLCTAVQSLAFFYTFQGFALPVAFFPFLVVLSCHQLSAVIAITPGGAGIQELAAVAISSTMRLPLEKIAVAFVLSRLCRTAFTVLLGGIGYYLLHRARRR